MDRKDVEIKLREIIAQRVEGLKADEFGASAELASLGIDSFAFSWILADMEETFDFVMRGADVLKLKTLSDAVDFVATRTKA